MHEALLDCGVLGAIRQWLEPLPNRSLPAVGLRRALLEVLKSLPVETDHLRESGIGKIVLFFARRLKEAPEVRRVAKDLVSRWSRPIIGDCSFRSSAADVAGQRGSEGGSRAGVSASMSMLQSPAYRAMAGKASDPNLASPHHKLAMHMQKRAHTKRPF